MSFDRHESVEKIPCASPVMRRREDALRPGTPFFDAAYFNHVHERMFYSRLSYLPLLGPVRLCDYTFEPAFVRKRNERERHRVRCVNEGYARLREHLPHECEDRRMSKVETLRAAIDYIKHLQALLQLQAGKTAAAQTDDADRKRKVWKHQHFETNTKSLTKDDQSA